MTGRVTTWSGQWPRVLSDLAAQARKDKEKPAARKPTPLIVTDFQTVKK